MKLAEWRQQQGLTQEELGELWERPTSTIWRWETGFRMPEATALEDIFRRTGGAVEPNDFHDLAAWRRALARVLDGLAGLAA